TWVRPPAASGLPRPDASGAPAGRPAPGIHFADGSLKSGGSTLLEAGLPNGVRTWMLARSPGPHAHRVRTAASSVAPGLARATGVTLGGDPARHPGRVRGGSELVSQSLIWRMTTCGS